MPLMDQQSNIDDTLVSPAVVKRWDAEFRKGADKQFPSLDLVRLEKWYFGSKPGRLLEYGFGCGVNLIYMLEKGYQVDAIDASIEALRLVAQKLRKRQDIRSHVALRHITAEETVLPYKDNTFDYITCISVLSLLSTKERVEHLLREFWRVLKPSGKMIADINGVTSDFAAKGTPLGNDIYEYPGGDGFQPFRSYCPGSEGKFRMLFSDFIIDDMGFSAHKYMGSEIFEYIACVRKPKS